MLAVFWVGTTDALCYSDLFLTAGNVRYHYGIGPGSWRMCSTFLLKVKCLLISQEEGEDAKLMMEVKVRDGFQATPAQRMKLQVESEETQGRNIIQGNVATTSITCHERMFLKMIRSKK